MIRYMNKMMAAGMVGLVGLVWVAPAAADDFGIGFSFSNGRGGPQIGVGLRLSDGPVVARPMTTRSVWVPTVQQTYRDVPVYNAWGQVVSYRREPVTVQSGYWSTVAQPVVTAPRTSGFGWTNWRGDRDDYRGHDGYQPRTSWSGRYPVPAVSHPVKFNPKGGHH